MSALHLLCGKVILTHQAGLRPVRMSLNGMQKEHGPADLDQELHRH